VRACTGRSLTRVPTGRHRGLPAGRVRVLSSRGSGVAYLGAPLAAFAPGWPLGYCPGAGSPFGRRAGAGPCPRDSTGSIPHSHSQLEGPQAGRVAGPRALHGVPDSGRADDRPEPYLVTVVTPPRPSSDWGMTPYDRPRLRPGCTLPGPLRSRGLAVPPVPDLRNGG
jgi:hypothetical protein